MRSGGHIQALEGSLMNAPASNSLSAICSSISEGAPCRACAKVKQNDRASSGCRAALATAPVGVHLKKLCSRRTASVSRFSCSSSATSAYALSLTADPALLVNEAIVSFKYLLRDSKIDKLGAPGIPDFAWRNVNGDSCSR